MNARIEQLAEQCWVHTNEPLYGAKSPHWEFDRQKFAELIVQECIDCARGAGLADDVAVRNKLGFNDGISEAVTHMKKHFGVEE
jgi:hypothetical protein